MGLCRLLRPSSALTRSQAWAGLLPLGKHCYGTSSSQVHFKTSVMSQLWRAPVQACDTNLQLRQELKLAREMLPGCARGSATRCDALQATSASVKMPCWPTRQLPCTLQISRLRQRTWFGAEAGLWPLCGHKPILREKLDTSTDWDTPSSELYCQSFQPLHCAQPPEHPRQ